MGLVRGSEVNRNGLVLRRRRGSIWLIKLKEETVWDIANKKHVSLNLTATDEKSTKAKLITKTQEWITYKMVIKPTCKFRYFQNSKCKQRKLVKLRK